VTAILAFFLLGIEDLGNQIEEPFSILPIEVMVIGLAQPSPVLAYFHRKRCLPQMLFSDAFLSAPTPHLVLWYRNTPAYTKHVANFHAHTVRAWLHFLVV